MGLAWPGVRAARSEDYASDLAIDLGGDTGNRTPDLLLANSRPGRRSLSLSTYAAHLVGMVRG